MNDDDIRDLETIRDHLRQVVNTYATLAQRMLQRTEAFDPATRPYKSLSEWSMWMSAAQWMGHMAHFLYEKVDYLITSYGEAKSQQYPETKNDMAWWEDAMKEDN